MGKEKELEAGIQFSFAVLPETPGFFKPSKGPFYDPALGYHGKGMTFRAFDHPYVGSD